MIEITSNKDVTETIDKLVETMIDGSFQDLEFLTRCLAMYNDKIELQASDILKILTQTKCSRYAGNELIELEHFEFVQNKFIPQLYNTTEQNDYRNKIISKQQQSKSNLDMFELLKVYETSHQRGTRYELNVDVPKRIRGIIETQPIQQLLSDLPRWKAFLENNDIRCNFNAKPKTMILQWLLLKLESNWDMVTPDNVYVINFSSVWNDNWPCFVSGKYRTILKRYFNTMLIDFIDHPKVQAVLPPELNLNGNLEGKLEDIYRYVFKLIQVPEFKQYEISNQFWLNINFQFTKEEKQRLMNKRDHRNITVKNQCDYLYSRLFATDTPNALKKYLYSNSSFKSFVDTYL